MGGFLGPTAGLRGALGLGRRKDHKDRKDRKRPAGRPWPFFGEAASLVAIPPWPWPSKSLPLSSRISPCWPRVRRNNHVRGEGLTLGKGRNGSPKPLIPRLKAAPGKPFRKPRQGPG